MHVEHWPPAIPFWRGSSSISHWRAEDHPELAGAWYEVYFDTNSIAINDRGQLIVENVAYVVANNAATRVTVIGKDRSRRRPARQHGAVTAAGRRGPQCTRRRLRAGRAHDHELD
jgi:peptidoglycan-associated lipoprotein